MKSEPHALIQTQKQAPLAHQPAGLMYSAGEIQEVPETGLRSPGTRWVTPAGHLSPKTAHHDGYQDNSLVSIAFSRLQLVFSLDTERERSPGGHRATEAPGNGSVVPAQPACHLWQQLQCLKHRPPYT